MAAQSRREDGRTANERGEAFVARMPTRYLPTRGSRQGMSSLPRGLAQARGFEAWRPGWWGTASGQAHREPRMVDGDTANLFGRQSEARSE